MEDFILCKSKDGNVLEIDVEDDETVGLETLKSVFGEKATGLTYTNPSTGRERLVRVSDKKMLEPKDGWGTPERVYCVTFGQEELNSPGVRAERVDVSNHQPNTTLTPQFGTVFQTARRLVVDHPLIKREEVASTNTSKIVTPDKVDNDSTAVELTKRQLLAQTKSSAVARTAVYQWNKLNTAVRMLVHKTKFRGSGGMLQCQGTSKKKAQQNQLLREAIAGDESVKGTFGTFYLENGQGKVTLDVLKAFEHVRHVLNDIRRARAGKDASKENDNSMDNDNDIEPQAPNDTDLEHNSEVQPSTSASVKTSLGEKIQNEDETTTPKRPQRLAGKRPTKSAYAPPKKSRKTRKSSSASSRVLKESQKLSEKVEEEILDNEDDYDDRAQYERENDAKRYRNKLLLHDVVLGGKPKLQEGDAVLVGRSWFKLGEKITPARIAEECEENGLSEIDSNLKLRAALVHFGNELVENNLVELKKPAGLSRDDIVCLV